MADPPVAPSVQGLAKVVHDSELDDLLVLERRVRAFAFQEDVSLLVKLLLEDVQGAAQETILCVCFLFLREVFEVRPDDEGPPRGDEKSSR